MALPPIVNITRVRGDNYSFGIVVQNSAGAAVDLTGTEVYLDIEDRVTNDVVGTITGVLSGTPTDGTVSFSPGVVVAALAEGIYDYFVRMTDATDEIQTVLMGRWTVVG